MQVSVLVELDEAEAAVTRLCKAIERKLKGRPGLRKEYGVMCNQAIAALNRIRSYEETQEFLRNFGSKSVGD